MSQPLRTVLSVSASTGGAATVNIEMTAQKSAIRRALDENGYAGAMLCGGKR